MDMKLSGGAFFRSSPESQGIPSEAIENCLEQIIDTGLNVHSLWVFRNGCLLAGGCARPFNAKQPRRLYSTMKSVIVLAVYFLIQEGRISLSDRLCDLVPEFMPDKLPLHGEELTVKDILMMSVGHERDSLREYHQSRHGIGMIPNTYRDEKQPELTEAAGKTLSQLFFSMPYVHAPGETFWYNNSIPEIIGIIVEKVSGEDYLSYLKPRLLDPLGIYDIKVNRNVETDGSSWNDGATMTVSIEDLCKFALFYLQRGSWEGKQLLDPSLIDEGTSYQIPTAEYVMTMGHGMSERDEYGYGYQIWRNKFGGYRMVGGSGQEAIILPEEDMVIVYTSFDRNTAGPDHDIDKIICDTIYKAARRSPLPENIKAQSNMNNAFECWTKLPLRYAKASGGENAFEGTYKAGENQFNISEVTFIPKESKVVFTVEGSVIRIEYGTGGDFKENKKGLGHIADGYTKIYGVDQEKCLAAGGYDDELFGLLLSYPGSMASHLIKISINEDTVQIAE